MMFATKSVFNYSTRKLSNITHIPTIHRYGREICDFHFLHYKCAQIIFTYRVFTEFTYLCDVGQNISNTKKPAINRLHENQNRNKSKLRERGYFLDVFVEETYKGKILPN